MAAAHGGRDAHESAASSSSGSSGSGKIECNTLFHHQTVFSCCSLPLLPVFAQGEVSTSTDPVDTTRARSVTSVKQRNKKCMPPARPSHPSTEAQPRLSSISGAGSESVCHSEPPLSQFKRFFSRSSVCFSVVCAVRFGQGVPFDVSWRRRMLQHSKAPRSDRFGRYPLIALHMCSISGAMS